MDNNSNYKTVFDRMSSKQPNVISIWIIRDKIKSDIISQVTKIFNKLNYNGDKSSNFIY